MMSDAGVQPDLIPVILRLSSCHSLDAIMEVLRESTRGLVGADGITIVLRDGDKCHYADEDAVGPLWKGKRFPMTACISGWCMLNKQQVVITDIYKDARIPHDAYRPTFVKSLAMTPIRAEDPVGAIGAYWATHYQPTPQQLATLQALGDSAAMALENSQLIDSLKDASRRKDQFLSMLAHELRNPLATFRSGLQLLQLTTQPTGDAEDTFGMMDRQVTQLSRLTDDLLDVARINAGKVGLKPVKFDLAALLRQCLSDRRQRFTTAELTLKQEIPQSPVWLTGDAARLTQAIGNVLDNAIKFTPANGTVTVRLTTDSTTQQATLDITDTGVGIPQPLLPHVFESFIQADTSLDRATGGLGLGLAVAHGLVTLHHGTITAQSDGPGHGSQFTIILPGLQAGAPAAAPDKLRNGNGHLHVLIIEDNRDAADTMQRVLKVCGYRTSVAYDGSAGVAMARSGKPDVVLCDIGLPEMDGYAVAKTLRTDADTAKARLIAVTGYGTAEDREKSRIAGFDSHMVKPVDLNALIGQIQNTPAAA